MLSKNNLNEKIKKTEPKKERFSIRKFTVGAASVLIGFFFMGAGQGRSVKADSAQDDTVTQTDEVEEEKALTAEIKEFTSDSTTTTEVNTPAVDTSEEVNGPPADTVVTEDTAAVVTEKTDDPESEGTSGANTVVSENTVSPSNNVTNDPATTAESTTIPVAEKTSEKDQTKEAIDKVKALAAEATEIAQVGDHQAFLDALRNPNVGTINLTSDVDFTGVDLKHGPQNRLSGHYEQLNEDNIARKVVINGGDHTLNMADRYIMFTNDNQKSDSNNWDIELKDLKLRTTSGYGPFWFENRATKAAKNTITFNGVTTTADSREIMWYNDGSTANVKFKGNNVINSNLNTTYNLYDGNTAAIYAYSVEVLDGNTTFNVVASPEYRGQNRAAIVIPNDSNAGNVVVNKNAILTINGDNKVAVEGMDTTNSHGTMGIRFKNWAKTENIDEAKTSVVQVAGTLNMNMGTGASTAILGSYVDVQEGGTISITTEQDGNRTSAGDLATDHNGTHFGVITGGLEASDKYSGVRIAKDGTLKIVRSTSNQSTQPLISLGDTGISLGKKFTIDVQPGGTLDLQDNAQNPEEWEPNAGTPLAGLITMWGTSSTNTVKINDPKYVNFQRTGTQPGSMLRLEGTTNNVSINGDGDAVTPIAQWDAGITGDTPTYYWYILNEANQNNWGTNSNGFTQKGETKPVNEKSVAEFLNSNGSVQMAPNQSGTNSSSYNNGTTSESSDQTTYLNQFLNHFNWWKPQRIAMGSALKDVAKPTNAQEYKPEVTDVTAAASDTLENVKPAEGIANLIDSSGNPVENGLSHVKDVTWLDSSADAENWKELMDTEDVPVNPTGKLGDLVPEDKYAWAKVTYNDDSIDFVKIPLNVIVDSMKDNYAPTYENVNVEQGEDNAANPVNPTFVDKNGNLVEGIPEGTKFASTVDTLSWITIDSSTGQLIIKPAADTEAKDYEIPVTVTYKDGTVDTVMAKVTVTPTKLKNADNYDPESQPIKVEQGEEPSPEAGISNKDDLPENTEYAWKEPVDTTTSGDKKGTIIITYPDKSTEEVEVTISVAESTILESDLYDPEPQPIEVEQGKDPDPAAGISNKDNLPENTKYEWKEPVDTTTSGDKKGTVLVTYSDDSTDEVEVTITVTEPVVPELTDSEKYTPESQDVTVEQGKEPDPAAGVKNKDDLPENTKYEWKDPVDTTTPGDQKGTVVVTYPDKSTDEVEVTITVTEPVISEPTDSEKYIPESQDVTVEQGKSPDPSAGISNKDELPEDTKYEWKEPVDTTTSGKKKGTILVTYPDKSTDEVEVTITVTEPVIPELTDSEKYNPESQDVTVEQGKEPDPAAGISNKDDLPENTKYEWKEPVDTTTSGDKKGIVLVTYPDETTDEVEVTITVTEPVIPEPTDSEKYIPESQDVTVEQGEDVDPSTGISNKDDLPENTKYEWKAPIDTTTSGDKKGTVIVTYPDKSTEEVEVTITVTEPVLPEPTDSEKYIPESQDVTVEQGEDVDPAAGISNKDDLPENTKYEWKEPVDTTLPGNQKGTVVVTYPDKSTEEVEVTITVTEPVIPELTDSEKYIPESQDVTVEQGKSPDPAAGISNKDDLPKNTKYEWKTPIDTTTSGEKKGTVLVTYPDETTEEVEVTIMVTEKMPVSEIADDHNLTYDEVNAKPGEKVKVTPTNTDKEGNLTKVPDGTEFKKDPSVPNWIEVNPDTGEIEVAPPVDTPTGEHEVKVTVEYPDGSKDEITVKVKVTTPTTPEPTDSEKYSPESQDVTVEQGKEPDPAAGISNKDDLPENTKYAWKTPVDTTTSGEKKGTILVTYPDKSTEEVEVTIKVTEPVVPELTDSEKYSPESQDVTVEQGEDVDPATGISNKDDLPENTKYEWKEPVDTTTSGDKKGIVLVTYPDETTDEVEVTITVTEPAVSEPTDSEKYSPESQDVTVEQGKSPDPAEGISNKEDLPENTKYEWKDPVDTTTSGDKKGTILVTYPDKSTEEVEVTITVTEPVVPEPTDSEKYSPESQDVTVEQGKSPDPSTGVKNKDDLPEGTKYAWKTPIDTTTPGDQKGTILVTYPDKSTEEVEVTIKVTQPSQPEQTDADKHTPEGNDITVVQGKVTNPADGISNKDNLPGNTKYEWKEPVDTTAPGEKTGTILVTYPDGSTDEVSVKITVSASEPGTTDTPSVPSTPTTDSSGNATDVPVVPKDETSNNPDTPPVGSDTEDTAVKPKDEDINNKKDKQTEPTKANARNATASSVNETESPDIHSRVVTTTTKQQIDNAAASTPTASTDTLPQTGEKNQSVGVWGMIIAAVGSLFGLGHGKKRRKEE